MNSNNKILHIMIGFVLILISGIAIVLFFRKLPIETTTLAIDWKTIYQSLHNGKVSYGNNQKTIGGFYTPPWGIYFLIPFILFPFKESWGIYSFISLIILIISVPHQKNKKLNVLWILMLITSFPAMRNLADGNLECLVIAGILLSQYALHAKKPFLLNIATLLTTIKFQETWLYFIYLIIFIIFNLNRNDKIYYFLSLFFLVTISMLLWGNEWLFSLFNINTHNWTIVLTAEMGRGSLIDISLLSSFSRLKISMSLGWILWIIIFCLTFVLTIKYFKTSKQDLSMNITLLIAASILLSPYASGNSYLTLFAIGIFPILLRFRYLGLILILSAYIPYIIAHDILYFYQSYFTLLQVLIFWAISAMGIYKDSIKPYHKIV